MMEFMVCFLLSSRSSITGACILLSLLSSDLLVEPEEFSLRPVQSVIDGMPDPDPFPLGDLRVVQHIVEPFLTSPCCSNRRSRGEMIPQLKGRNGPRRRRAVSWRNEPDYTNVRSKKIHPRFRAIASHFWKRSISCVITGQLSKLCSANALYRTIENLDAIALTLAFLRREGHHSCNDGSPLDLLRRERGKLGRKMGWVLPLLVVENSFSPTRLTILLDLASSSF
jgi:hypothetical protein